MAKYRIRIQTSAEEDVGFGPGVIAETIVDYDYPVEVTNDPRFLRRLLSKAAEWRDMVCGVVVSPID